jgi:sugar lactone lactonase YvrE
MSATTVSPFKPAFLTTLLGNCSETPDRNAASRCIALLRSVGPPHIHVRIATNRGEKCGLDPQTLALRGEFGADHQSGTHDIDFDNRGRAYVADTHNNRVLIYEVDGLQAERVGQLDARIRGPEGLLVHSNGRVYVAGAWSGNVVAYENGQVVAELSGLSSPHDLEISRDGDIWLADAGNDRLLLVSADLDIKLELGRSDYAFDGVRYLDLTPQGTIVAADKNNHVIKFIDAQGELLLVLGDGRAGRGPNRFTTPEGVELSGSTLWLSDSGNDRIVKYRINE